ncbi:hypothetical protein [Nonomuraea typhae]|uniref:Beta/gamma crystallin 'Greek key' domain-containing protein n=1 Tax=Nonomuraea typhae TaxID=2603600 RepID=A0ABW7Z916_9ACTN
MLKKLSIATASIGVLAMLSIAAPAQAGTQAAGATASSAATCLELIKWYNGQSTRFVRVKNHCSGASAFCVDVPNWDDKGPFWVDAYSTKDVSYISRALPQGRAIYYCTENP